MQLVRCLARGGEVGLLGDPLAGEGALHLVVHHLDLLVHENVGDLDGRVLHRVLDDPVGEAVARAVQGVPLQSLADLGAQGGHVGEVAHRAGEVVVGDGHDLLAQLLQLCAEVDLDAAERLLLVVVGERDVELGRLARPHAEEMLLEAGDEALLADDERHPVGGPAVEWSAVTRADVADDRPVALRGRPLLDRAQRRLLVAELVHDALDLGVVDGLDLGPEREVGVVAQLHLGAQRHNRLVAERLPLLGLDDLDLGAPDDEDVGVVGGALRPLAVAGLDERLDGLVPDRALAQDTLEHAARGLARAEPGDPGALAQAAGGVGDGARNAIDGELHLDDEGALLGRGRSHMHGRGSIGADQGHRPIGRLRRALVAAPATRAEQEPRGRAGDAAAASIRHGGAVQAPTGPRGCRSARARVRGRRSPRGARR